MKSPLPIQPQSMPTKKAAVDDSGKERLTSRQNEQVRGIGRDVLRDRFDQNGSRYLNGKQGTTREVALKILALADIEPSVVGLDAPASDVFPRKPVVSHLPGWQDAEREARRIYRRIPDAADELVVVAGASR